MEKLFVFITALIATNCFSQTGQKFSTFVSLHVNKTLYDNDNYLHKSAIAGVGFQTLLNTKSRLKATLELTADLFTVPNYGPADELLNPKKIIIPAIYVGPSFQLTDRIFIATTVGTSIYTEQAHFGIRPSVEFYPSKKKYWAAKASFTNVFQEHTASNTKDFGYMSFGLNFRL